MCTDLIPNKDIIFHIDFIFPQRKTLFIRKIYSGTQILLLKNIFGWIIFKYLSSADANQGPLGFLWTWWKNKKELCSIGSSTVFICIFASLCEAIFFLPTILESYMSTLPKHPPVNQKAYLYCNIHFWLQPSGFWVGSVKVNIEVVKA